MKRLCPSGPCSIAAPANPKLSKLSLTQRVTSRARGGTVWIEPNGAEEPLLCVAGQAPHVDRRIGDFLRREARWDLEAASLRFAGSLGVAVKRVAVRDQASRWGSCSSTGVLSYSWRLILAPPFVLNYLAAHEVAHLAEMNHSARFWRLVQRLCPDHQQTKEWLDVSARDLDRSGFAAGLGACAALRLCFFPQRISDVLFARLQARMVE